LFVFWLLFVWVFFFQAEDGIRDDLVTGVQTCALPIYFRPGGVEDLDLERVSGLGGRRGVAVDPQVERVVRLEVPRDLHLLGQGRSEERRVGKECRSRWAADAYK